MASFQALKEKIIVLLGGNVAGYRLKPFVIWHSEKPRVFNHISKHTLIVYYRSSRKSWITQLFCSKMPSGVATSAKWRNSIWRITYLSRLCLLLIMLLGILLLFGDLQPNVKVVFLHPNTTSFIQPMDQGVIATFKARTFAQALAATEKY